MTKLNELIQQLCPDGVKYYTLNTVCNVYDGTHKTPKYTDSGIKFASVENIADPYATEKYISISDYEKYKIKPQRNDLLMTRIGSIGVCTVIESDEPLAYYVSLALLRPDNSILNSRYLKYAIESLHCRKELRKRTLVNAVPIKINMGDIGKITLPVPPLPVQSEIVRILDNFTELTTELTARKKQYEFYRDKLLTFGDVQVGVTSDVIRRTLGEVCKISAGGDAPKDSMSKQKTEKYSVPIISNGIGENWLSILNGLKNRGVEDILIACVDGLTGFPEAISAVYPKTEVQQCIIHQIRNSTRYVSYKDIKALMADLKKVYAAVDEETALYELEQFATKWDSKYPKISALWKAHWSELSTYFKYPQSVRTLIYTTNSIGNFNRQLRKVSKNRSVFPNDDSLLKMLYLAQVDITRKWTVRRRDQSEIHSQLEIFFADRLPE